MIPDTYSILAVIGVLGAWEAACYATYSLWFTGVLLAGACAVAASC